MPHATRPSLGLIRHSSPWTWPGYTSTKMASLDVCSTALRAWLRPVASRLSKAGASWCHQTPSKVTAHNTSARTLLLLLVSMTVTFLDLKLSVHFMLTFTKLHYSAF